MAKSYEGTSQDTISPAVLHHKQPFTPATAKDKAATREWKELCDGWEYSWGLRSAVSMLGRLQGLTPESRTLWIKEQDSDSEPFVVRVGDCVMYQYDDCDTIAKVLKLYSGKGGEPRFKHTCFWTAEDIAQDQDKWELPSDGPAFHKSHEVVYDETALDDEAWRIQGRCTVRAVKDQLSDAAVLSAIARCDREVDSFFWRYQLPRSMSTAELDGSSNKTSKRKRGNTTEKEGE